MDDPKTITKSEIRNRKSEILNRAILLDIEGTTTPISFVFDVLFPYARRHLADYLKRKIDLPEVRADIAALNEEHACDVTSGLRPPDVSDDEILDYAYWLMDRNSKSTGLKSLQGKIWQEGYLNGQLRSTVFPDVRPAMERWQNVGINVSIFSSGSVLAQQLLFSHTENGDLTKFISNYFDTGVGTKTKSSSYQVIASRLSFPERDIHFISDVPAELDAAGEAGMQTSLCIRPGNAEQEHSKRHKTIRSFDEVGV